VSWRPSGWENPCGDDNLTGQSAKEAFEAGADAILEGLRKEPLLILKGLSAYPGNLNPIYGQVFGTLVFIPDEVK
jgi:hypothetical protein